MRDGAPEQRFRRPADAHPRPRRSPAGARGPHTSAPSRGLLRPSRSASWDLEYRYSATQNNGQITQLKDWRSGEEVSYQYDSLSRLISAVTTGPEWGQSYSYDGFGNRTLVTVTKGTAPSGNLTYDGMTNRITNPGFSYDANGNLTAMPGLSMGYDYDNRLSWAGNDGYGYDPENRRVWRGTGNNQEVYFYGVDGRKLGTYQVNWDWTSIQTLSENLYFAGRLIKSNSKWVVTDRLGSVVKSEYETLRYFPWGEERSTTTQNRDKFATYFRDSTGLDYALNRYYSSSHGRFLTPDPYVASASLTNPQSWNRYPYVENDPVNYHDPGGLLRWVPTPFPRLPETTNTTTVVRTREGDILNQPGDGVPDAEETEGEESDGWDPIQSALAVARNAATFIENKGDWSAQCEKTLGAVGTSLDSHAKFLT